MGKLSKNKDGSPMLNEEWNKDWNGKFTMYNWSELESILDKIENFEANVIR